MAEGILKALTRVPFPAYKELVGVTIFIWLLISGAFIYKFAPDVYAMDLGDNDNYMRYEQFTGWLKQGNWYLTPMPKFNPQDGVLIHWSRIPDLLLASITLICSLFLSERMAEVVAMSITPSLYFFPLLLAVGAFTYRVLGRKYSFISLVFISASIVIGKFIPGQIDHHNIQLMFAALFLSLTPFRRYECKVKSAAILQGILIGLSFAVGMENLIFFVPIMVVVTFLGYQDSNRFLYYARLVCFSAIISSILLLPVNRPFNEFFIFRVDALSISYVFALCCGYLFCSLSLFVKKRWDTNIYLTYLLLGAISVAPMVLFTPEILLGLFYNYPALLKKFWLSRVTEAISTLDYINRDGIFSSNNFIFQLFPAFLSIIFIRKNPVIKFIYILFIFLAVPFIFWQARTVFASILVAAPLQAYFAIQCSERTKSILLQVVTILFCSPIALMILMGFIHNLNPEFKNSNTTKLHTSDIISLIKKHHISDSKILAPFDYGAKILAITNNRVISAPYHRNINGNLLTIELYTNTNLKLVYKKLKINNIDYIMFGPNSTSKIFSIYSDKNSFINQLYSEKIPPWLKLLEHNEQGFFLFKVNTQ